MKQDQEEFLFAVPVATTQQPASYEPLTKE
jgi:hypothetical protein